jgi:hypothetical protein
MRWFLLLVLVFSLAACDDDDSGSCGCPQDPWQEQSLPGELVNGGIWDLEVRHGRAVGLAVSGGGSWVIEEGPGGWEVVGDEPLPGTGPVPPGRAAIEPSRAATAITVDSDGALQVVGGLIAGERPVVWSETGGTWTYEDGDASGLLQEVVALSAGEIFGAGTGGTGIPFVTGSADAGFEHSVLALGGEAGLTSLVEESGAVYGCGFNDAADGTQEDPYRMVMKYEGEAWQRLPSPCLGCGSFNFSAIDASPEVLYVGGSSTAIQTPDEPYGDGVAVETAWLSKYSFVEPGWTQLVLPDAELLQRVNAVLAASNGDLYLACGSPDTPAYLLRGEPGEEFEVEAELPGVRLFSLAETPDGRILAAGLEPGEVEGRPVLLQR